MESRPLAQHQVRAEQLVYVCEICVYYRGSYREGKEEVRGSCIVERPVSTVLSSSVERTAMSDEGRGRKRKQENQSERGYHEQQIEG